MHNLLAEIDNTELGRSVVCNRRGKSRKWQEIDPAKLRDVLAKLKDREDGAYSLVKMKWDDSSPALDEESQ